ncbi:MAG: hypothetical protein ACPGRC_05515 [Salibacteraceae bacterium]
MANKTENNRRESHSSESVYLESSIKSYFRNWEISGYVVTNAISSGAFLLLFIGLFLNHVLEQPFMTVRPSAIYAGALISITFLVITALLLARDIQDYSKFIKGLINPKVASRFVFGAYAIFSFAILTSLFAISVFLKWKEVSIFLIYSTAFAALVVSISTTYLLHSPNGPIQWNRIGLNFHMLSHSFMAGGAAYSIVDAFFRIGTTWGFYVDLILQISITCNLIINIIEFILTRKKHKQSELVWEITKGKFKFKFWIGKVLMGNIIPFVLVFFSNMPVLQTLAGVFIIIGIWISDRIWIAAPILVNNRLSQKVINIKNG